MKTTALSEASVYVGTYGKYNNGSLFGAWLDLSDYADKEEFYEACRELHKDEEDAEFMFQDYENIPENLISESKAGFPGTSSPCGMRWKSWATPNRKPFSCGATTKTMI